MRWRLRTRTSEASEILGATTFIGRIVRGRRTPGERLVGRSGRRWKILKFRVRRGRGGRDRVPRSESGQFGTEVISGPPGFRLSVDDAVLYSLFQLQPSVVDVAE
jgi:hypothetical protein